MAGVVSDGVVSDAGAIDVIDDPVTGNAVTENVVTENVVMMPGYMTAPVYLSVAGYAGDIISCRFVQADYQDSDFALTGIILPAQLQRAVVKRKAEYLAGRCLARLLLRKAGIADGQLLNGTDRAPCWPAGVCGAISHNSDQVLCAMSNNPLVTGTGIDVENIIAAERAAKLATSILAPREMAWLTAFSHIDSDNTASVLSTNHCGGRHADFALLLTLAFSAKESLFKAIYPHVQRYFSFYDAELCHIDLQHHYFRMVLMTTLNPTFPAGREFTGRYFYDGQTVITFLYF